MVKLRSSKPVSGVRFSLPLLQQKLYILKQSQKTRRKLLKARFFFWSRFRHWAAKAFRFYRKNWPLLTTTAVYITNPYTFFSPFQPPRPLYISNLVTRKTCLRRYQTFLFFTLLAFFTHPCLKPLPMFIYLLSLLRNTSRYFFTDSGLHKLPIIIKFATKPNISINFFKINTINTVEGAGQLNSEDYKKWLFFQNFVDLRLLPPASISNLSTPPALLNLFLFYRPRFSMIGSRRFINLRYRLFIFRGLGLRVLSYARRRRKLRKRFGSRITTSPVLRFSRTTNKNNYLFYMKFWWYRVIVLGSSAIYRIGLRINPLNSLFWTTSSLDRLPAVLPVRSIFFLYMLYKSPFIFKDKVQLHPYFRLLVKNLLTHKLSLVGALVPNNVSLGNKIIFKQTKEKNKNNPLRVQTNLFNIPSRAGRYPSCFLRLVDYKWFAALRVFSFRILPWRGRFRFLHHRVRCSWFCAPLSFVSERLGFLTNRGGITLLARTRYRLHGKNNQTHPQNLLYNSTRKQYLPKKKIKITPWVFFFNSSICQRSPISLFCTPVTLSRLLQLWRGSLLEGAFVTLKRYSFTPITGTYVGSYFSNYINRFFEYFLGTSTATIINFELIRRIPLIDFFFLESLKSRLRLADSLFSTIFFINEFIDLVFMALKLKNFNHLVNYLNRLLKSLIIWEHKRFLVFFFGAFREQFLPMFPYFGITGLHLIIKGKVGVGGNSRKRSMSLRLGTTSRTHTFVNAHSLNTWLNTSTGALGFRVFLFYTNSPYSPYY